MLTIINTQTTIEKIVVNKVWDDNSNINNNRPESITIQLLANGEAFGNPVTLSGNKDTWIYEFTNLPTHINGKEVTYTVQEISEVVGYETSYSEDTLTITNKETTIEKITVTKVWDDIDNADGYRPNSVTVYLLLNGEKIDSVELSADNNWTYTFKNLAQYVDKAEAVYTVVEQKVEHYDATYSGNQKDGFVITNIYDDFGEGDIEEEIPPYTGIDDNYNNISGLLFMTSLLLLGIRKKYVFDK